MKFMNSAEHRIVEDKVCYSSKSSARCVHSEKEERILFIHDLFSEEVNFCPFCGYTYGD